MVARVITMPIFFCFRSTC